MKFRSSLYAALLLTANAAFADVAAVEALKDGDMKKLMFSDAAKPAGQTPITAADGSEVTLADYRGKVVVVNFWATWCAPCRKEMPSLDALQAALGGDDFAVVPVATLRTKQTGAEKFFDEIGIEHLPILMDENGALAREMGVMGLPVTVILDRDGNEIARLMGDAEWDSDSAKAILKTVIDDGKS